MRLFGTSHRGKSFVFFPFSVKEKLRKISILKKMRLIPCFLLHLKWDPQCGGIWYSGGFDR
jgi:hypothetical protein